MQKNDNRNLWLTMRVGRGTLSFAMPADDAEGKIDFEPYVVKSGISLAANLREAFGAANLLQQPPQRLRLVVDSPVLMVPIELFDQDEMEVLYDHAFTRSEQDGVCYNVLPDLNAVAVFSLNKDLKLVADDHFPTVKVVAAMSPVWRHLHQRSYTGNRRKLYGYFHERQLEVFAFQQNRFRFCNTFRAHQPEDALFFLLYVWKQLQLDPAYDELHIVGDIADSDLLMSQLHRYLQNTYLINTAVDLGSSSVTEIKGMPYDLQTLFLKGR